MVLEPLSILDGGCTEGGRIIVEEADCATFSDVGQVIRLLKRCSCRIVTSFPVTSAANL